jgi:glycosyltransferase involved in cell wall biosynthesis
MPDRNLKILYVTSVCPYGPACGAQIRVQNIGLRLRRLGRVSLVIAPIEDVDPEGLSRARAEFETVHVAEVRPEKLAGFKERLRFEADPTFLNTYFSAARPEDGEILHRMMPEHDVVWVHTIRTANEFRVFKWPRSVIDIDDLTSRFYASRTRSDPGAIRRMLNARMTLIWRRREKCLQKRFDVLCVCSENDRRYLAGGPGVHVVRNGFASPSQPPVRRPAAPARLGFIGTFKYLPNRLGVDWFIKNVWPRVKQAVPDSRLRLVGLESDAGLPRMGPDIDAFGYVDDPAQEIATWSAMIVPIQAGGGTRIKIAEAFSRKCPVVSTSLGAYGYESGGGSTLLLADRPAEFAAACVRLIRDPEVGARISNNAWAEFLRTWTWDAIGPSVDRAVEACLTSNAKPENGRTPRG